jgi:hypothetical protein
MEAVSKLVEWLTSWHDLDLLPNFETASELRLYANNLSGGHFETHAMSLTVAASGGQGFNFDYSGSGDNNRGCF